MGLIKTGVQLGTVYVIAQQGMKAYDSHNKAKAGQQQQQQAPPQGQYYYQPQQQQQQQQTRSASDCFHQVWCNGQCGGQCNAIRSIETPTYYGEQQRGEKPPAY